MDTHNSVGQLPTIPALLRKWLQDLDRLAAMNLVEDMTGGSKPPTILTHDAIWVKLWQPWRGCTAGLHNINEDVYILAVAFSSSISLQFDMFLACSYP